MRVQISLDWSNISSELRSQMHSAPAKCKKDLARMIGQIETLVHKLGSEEVELRRNRKNSSPRQQELLVKINESITDYEKWLMLAYLQHG
jgi:competence protein ComGF